MPAAMAQQLDAFIDKWAASGASERANKDLFLAELCGVLDVAPPNPATGDPERDTYVFERAATLPHEDGQATIGRIDLYKQGAFILEAKQASGEGASKLGKAKRGTAAWNILMRDAFGQALGYARSFDKPEPFVIVKLKEAVAVVRDFHTKLCHTRVLDPACGSGNFLYVTLDLFKRLEGEILGLLQSLGEKQTLMHMEGVTVTPQQFHGIEIKRWAKEIAELVLWIGYLQWHFRMYGKSIPVPEPVLRDYKNIECRDAVLAYDGEPELVRDENGKPVTRWDGETMKTNPVTGEEVPDETKYVFVYTYKNPRKAEWPEADFIVGNPPFVGNKRMLSVLTEGYAAALREAHEDVPDSADFVMYWWNSAAALVSSSKVRRAGLITTNSITQAFNRKIVERWLAADGHVSICYATPDHPWVSSSDGAAVRIAMTAVGQGKGTGRLAVVVSEEQQADHDEAVVVLSEKVGTISPSLSVAVDVKASTPLQANGRICGQGVKVVGDGFYVDDEFESAARSPTTGAGIVRAIINPQDVLRGRTPRRIIDFFGIDEEAARKASPKAYQQVRDRVKPLRDQNKRDSIRRLWWRFAWERPVIRQALHGLKRYFVTLETSKHRFFVAVPGDYLWDGSLFAVATEDWSVMGVLSSRVHLPWALAAGSRLGVGNDPRWRNNTCFDPFPFPKSEERVADRIRALAEELDAHRKRQQAAHPDLTITGMYNVLEKLRSGEVLTAKDKIIHEQGLVSVLKKLHDDLDAAVFDAYGWPHDLTDEQILERLVALNAERAAEERRGLIRWLRPEFQNPSGAKPATQADLDTTDEPDEAAPAAVAAAAAWPKKLPEQIAAVRDLVAKAAAEWTVAAVAAAFKGAKKADVEDVLDSLAALGIVAAYDTNGTRRWKSTRAAA